MTENYTIQFQVVKFQTTEDLINFMMNRLLSGDVLEYDHNTSRIIRTMQPDRHLSERIEDDYHGTYDDIHSVMIFHSTYHSGFHMDRMLPEKDYIFSYWKMCFLSNERTATLEGRKYAKPAKVERDETE